MHVFRIYREKNGMVQMLVDIFEELIVTHENVIIASNLGYLNSYTNVYTNRS